MIPLDFIANVASLLSLVMTEDGMAIAMKRNYAGFLESNHRCIGAGDLLLNIKKMVSYVFIFINLLFNSHRNQCSIFSFESLKGLMQ